MKSPSVAFMTHSETIEISVAPEVAFDAISDLPSMGTYSPENTGGTWKRGVTGPRDGARFKGTNAQGSQQWTTTAKITTFERPGCFAFRVTLAGVAISDWEFCIEATDDGCRVTEQWTDRRNSLTKKFAKVEGVDDRAAYTLTSMRTTLENLKTALEGTKA